MTRTTSEAVAGIIEVDESISIAPFIETASVLVTDCCTGTAGPATPYSDERLELIERWLAAHFYAVRDRRPAFEQAGPVSAKYENFVDAGLASTMYGTQVMLIDTNGGLAVLSKQASDGKKRQAGVYWMGSCEERTCANGENC